VAVHAVCYETLIVVSVAGCLPGVVGKPYLVTRGAEPGCGCPHHRGIGDAEDGKGKDNPHGNE